MSIKSYKGFNKDMTCRGFKYEEGKEYTTDKAKACESGFHACEYPLDCFSYYNPSEAVFHEVEQDGDLSRHIDDSKIASTNIKIGVRLSIVDMVKAAIDFTMSKIKPESMANENCGASSATGNYGASSATGYHGASSATGYHGASSATGDRGTSSATGYHGASSATGNYGASSATGYHGASSATGYCGVAVSTGQNSSALTKSATGCAVAWGYHAKAKGIRGSRIVLADWEYNNNTYKWEFKGAKMVKIDGKKYKADVWYTMKNGQIVEVE